MKRILSIFMLWAAVAVMPLWAQEPIQKAAVKEVEATVGQYKCAKQGSYMPSFASDRTDRPVKNVILMIGDGMGLATVATAMYANGGELTMTNLQTTGFVRTQSADSFTTDSAASGTAYATGQKTYNNAVGLGADRNVIENIPEKLEESGIVSGIVSTDNLDGATPSAFFAHQAHRNMSKEIWADMPMSKLTFFSAGSQEEFEKQPSSTVSAILDNFTVVHSADAKKAIKKSKRLGYLPPASETTYKVKGRGNYLPETTEMAIEYLSARSDKGFFLMVEGARIDKAAHSNDYGSMIEETLDFDKAVEAAVRFAEQDGNTLVIISADHETGAVSLRSGDMEKGKVKGVYVSRGHTPIMVPLFAFGPHSMDFSGMQENSDVSNKIVDLLLGK